MDSDSSVQQNLDEHIKTRINTAKDVKYEKNYTETLQNKAIYKADSQQQGFVTTGFRKVEVPLNLVVVIY